MHYLDDVLTALRFVGAVVISCLCGVGPEVAAAVLAIFVLAELTDAFDGECARRWPYPADGKRRWWRVHAETLDQVADLALAAAVLLYVGLYLQPVLAVTIFIVTVVVAVPVQIWRNQRIRRIPNEDDDPLRVRVILARRVLYLAGIVALVLTLLVAVLGDNWVAWTITLAAALVVGSFLLWFKRGRLTRDKPKVTQVHQEK